MDEFKCMLHFEMEVTAQCHLGLDTKHKLLNRVEEYLHTL